MQTYITQADSPNTTKQNRAIDSNCRQELACLPLFRRRQATRRTDDALGPTKIILFASFLDIWDRSIDRRG